MKYTVISCKINRHPVISDSLSKHFYGEFMATTAAIFYSTYNKIFFYSVVFKLCTTVQAKVVTTLSRLQRINNKLHVLPNNETLCTLIRSKPASILSCSTNFLAWAMLLVVDILCHRLSCQVKGENSTRKQRCNNIKMEAAFKECAVWPIDNLCNKLDKMLLEVLSNSLHAFEQNLKMACREKNKSVIIKGILHPKLKTVIIYSPLCCSKL